jgi:hypothetical protein
MTESFTAVASGVVTVDAPRALPERYLADLINAEGSVSTGWLGDGVILASRAARGAEQTFGADHEAAQSVIAYRDAIRDAHQDTTTTTYDVAGLRQRYLIALGALSAAAKA